MEIQIDVQKLIAQLEDIYHGGPKGNLWQARPLLGEYIEKLKAAYAKQVQEFSTEDK
jgi:hypothetical protein